MWQFGMESPKEPAVFLTSRESNSGLLDVQKHACKQLWRAWGTAVHKPNCWKGFCKLNPKHSPVTNFIHAIKILRVERKRFPPPDFQEM